MQEEIMYLLVEFIGTGKYTVVALRHIESEDGSTESAHVGELVHIGEHYIESLMPAPRETRHSTMLTIGLGAEMGVNVGDEVAKQHGIEGGTVILETPTERSCHIAALHHHDHRHSAALGNGIVHDMLHTALMAPARLVLTHAMLQIEHGIALAAFLIASWCIHHGVTPRGSAL